jgi:pimeloyl-ACP methyl ester carboxylesterase/DNA-binding CsgD family transcriptional regulator
MIRATQEIRFCTSHDGARLAYARSGRGPPLVKAANWLSHLEFDWESPVWRPWLAQLSADHTLIRYDARGSGLSDWNVETSFEAWVRDLETVVEASGARRFPLIGISQGASVAIAYAARHPERVSHLVLYGGYARGPGKRATSEHEREEAETMGRLAELGWGRENPAFRQFFTTQFIPDGTPEQHRWFNELERISTSPANAGRFIRVLNEIDVGADLGAVQCPTLVLHAVRDARVPFEEGRLLAGGIAGARFVPLESNNHVLLDGEPAWSRWFEELRSFLRSSGAGVCSFPGLTARERELLDLLARGRDNAQIAASLALSEKTVRNHVSSIFAKLEVDNRARAVVLAREAGFGGGADP